MIPSLISGQTRIYFWFWFWNSIQMTLISNSIGFVVVVGCNFHGTVLVVDYLPTVPWN